jgi:hypothetical protein
MSVVPSSMKCVALLLVCLVLLSLSSNTQGVSQSKRKSSGLPVSPETEASFDRVQKRKQQPPAAQSQEDPFSLADLNRDGKCDRRDIKLFRKVLGKCERAGGRPLVTFADFDLDGCVTKKDRHTFLDLWHACKNSNKRR